MNEIIDLAKASGWTVTKTGRGHWKFSPPSGKPIYHAGTSCSWSGWANFVSHLRRAGLDVPHRGEEVIPPPPKVGEKFYRPTVGFIEARLDEFGTFTLRFLVDYGETYTVRVREGIFPQDAAAVIEEETRRADAPAE